MENKGIIRNKLMDALSNIRVSLGIEKLKGPKIKREKFKLMIDNEILRINSDIDTINLAVKESIDSLFDEYFPKEKAPLPEKNTEYTDKNPMSLADMAKSNLDGQRGKPLIKLPSNNFSSDDNMAA